MKCIIGLGNPGFRYRNTRHNVGFLVVKAFAKKNKIKIDKKRFSSLISQAHIDNEDAILAMPLTFMNLSGEAVLAIIKHYRLKPKEILVVCDDVNLSLGKIRIRPSGSAGGHNGLKSIIQSLETSDFARLRIGIDDGLTRDDLVRFVLSPFSKNDKPSIDESIKKSVDACTIWVKDGVVKAMDMFN